MDSDILIIMWSVVLVLLIVVFTYFVVPSLIGSVSLNDIRLGRLQSLESCQTNQDCGSLRYCQAYDVQGLPSSALSPRAFGVCQPRMMSTV